MKHNHSLFTSIRAFLASYVAFPNPVYADICALWVMGTHTFKTFDSFAYIVITASTKRAGKSTLAELMSLVAHKGVFGTSMSASIMRRLIAAGSSMFFDEAESLNSEAASAQREYLNAGYRRGGKVFMPGAGPDEVITYEAYGPKCFILIGDVNDTLRDRSIPIELVRGKAEKPYRRTQAEADAADLNLDPEQLEAMFTKDEDALLGFDVYQYLDGREAEVWHAILALASVYAPQQLEGIVKIAVDLNSLKSTTEKRTFREIRVEAEDAANDIAYSEKALIDLHAAFKHGEKAIHVEQAIERMKAMLTSPWRTYKGTGLTPVMLSDLLSSHVKKGTSKGQKQVKIGGVNKRGFLKVDVDAWIKGLGK